MKTCERCKITTIYKDRFCKKCTKIVLSELNELGYLETGGYGHKGQSRTNEMKENIFETKHM